MFPPRTGGQRSNMLRKHSFCHLSSPEMGHVKFHLAPCLLTVRLQSFIRPLIHLSLSFCFYLSLSLFLCMDFSVSDFCLSRCLCLFCLIV